MNKFQEKVYPVVKIAKLINKRQSCYSNFYFRVYNVVRTIKRGQTMTYAEVAKLAGNPKAVRAVGNALNKNYDSDIPCHRVIRSDDKLGGYNRGTRLKRKLLIQERAIKSQS